MSIIACRRSVRLRVVIAVDSNERPRLGFVHPPLPAAVLEREAQVDFAVLIDVMGQAKFGRRASTVDALKCPLPSLSRGHGTAPESPARRHEEVEVAVAVEIDQCKPDKNHFGFAAYLLIDDRGQAGLLRDVSESGDWPERPRASASSPRPSSTGGSRRREEYRRGGQSTRNRNPQCDRHQSPTS